MNNVKQPYLSNKYLHNPFLKEERLLTSVMGFGNSFQRFSLRVVCRVRLSVLRVLG